MHACLVLLLAGAFSKSVCGQQSAPRSTAPAALDACRGVSAEAAAESQTVWAGHLGTRVVTDDNPLDMKLVLIPPGKFLMGNEESVAELMEEFTYAKEDWLNGAVTRHEVTITQPFLMGRHEVTVAQFREFVDESGYQTEAERDGKGGYGLERQTDGSCEFKQNPKFLWGSPGFPQEDDHPVTQVSWNDAARFCAWLSNETGRIYRLPTEAEWEYACRAGTTTRYHSGQDPEGLIRVGNTWDSKATEVFSGVGNILKGSDGFVFTSPVGRYRSNAFGLYDMHGNVFEWCQDWYGEDWYDESPSVDPQGPRRGSSRVVRGGSWGDNAVNCRSAGRGGSGPSYRDDVSGFRVVCEF
jgi:formylglycine-generating enzyme required for sulfatase activity